MNYLDTVNKRTLEYFKVLESDFPEWLWEYINTEALFKQNYISVTCGTIYSDLFESSYFYSSLDHSIGVALIVWHFTHDKKQTLAGLFHDIATPVFKHCIDFLNGDYMTQESTEDLTTEIISNSSEIMRLLKRDNIKLEEVNDYHKYPIADNDTPMLSADRLEYTLSNALFHYNKLNLQEIEEIYNDIIIQSNENNVSELGFKTLDIAMRFVRAMSKLAIIYFEERTRYSMQFLADIVKKLNEKKLITIDDLYSKKESDIIRIIESSKYSKVYDIWKTAKMVNISQQQPENVYFVQHGAKKRYINPLVNGKRITLIEKEAKELIDKVLNYDMSAYIWLDFDF